VSEEDVLKVVDWAMGEGIPLVSRGAGTGLSGGAVAEQGGLILSFSRMNQILELDPIGRSVKVQPGVVNQVLDESVKRVGLYYPPDPASGRTATIGGNIGENAGGPHCFKYGVTTHYVNGLQVVLADGSLVQFGGTALDYPEYDFVSLFSGSEGTLGIITQADLHLLRKPPAEKTMMAAFENVQAAGDAVSAIIARGLVPATMEFMDQKIMKIIEDYAHAGLPIEAGAALIIEVDGFESSLDHQMREIIQILQEKNASKIQLAQTAEEREKIWYGRKSAAGAMARLSPAYYLLDGTVPRSRLADTLLRVNQICLDHELRVGYVFHAGDGNLHPFILVEDPHDQMLLDRVHTAGEQIMQICVEQDGSITGEHGVGIEKRPFLTLMYNSDELGAMLDVKEVFDKNHLLNPGKIFPEFTASSRESLELNSNPEQSREQKAYYEPSTTTETQQIVLDSIAAGRDLHLVGGGSKIGLQKPDVGVLRTGRMNQVHAFVPEDLYVTVGAGMSLESLQSTLEQKQVWVPLASPWSQSTLGGILSSNYNAPLRMRYGSISDLVLGVKVILPDGRLLRLGRPVVKNVAGYDLAKLFVGAWGTLGILTEVTLKLSPLPRSTTTLVAGIDILEDALSAGLQLLQVCLNASALLLCRGEALGLDFPYTLLYTAQGYPHDVEEELQQVETCLQASGIKSIEQRLNLSGSSIWGDWIQTVIPFKSELEKPVMRSGAAVKELPRLFDTLKPQLENIPFILDIANGLLYTQGVWDIKDWRQNFGALGGYAVFLGAPDSFLEQNDPWAYQPQSLALMKALKNTWDPHNHLNPGTFIV
jgi:D-lactate dehydrogenase (cytochrome)